LLPAAFVAEIRDDAGHGLTPMRGGGTLSGLRLGVVALGLCLVLAGCGSNAPSAQVSDGAGRKIALTPAQSAVVEAGLKEMTEDATAAPTGPVVAMAFDGEPGTHVCGHVKKGGATLPWYIELREQNGTPVAERGQVGSDPSKLSKVTFVCRRHGTA
jgi:hypothetical protein